MVTLGIPPDVEVLLLVVVARCWQCFVVVVRGGGGSRKSNYFVYRCLFKENLNASKPSDQSTGLGGNIGCRDKNSTWYKKGSPMESHRANSIIWGRSPL